MKLEFEKKMHIAGDLLSYCHMKGADEFHIDMSSANGVTVFKIKASPADISAEETEQLIEMLNMPRDKELENDYWTLAGESENFTELALVGAMTDSADMEYSDKVLTITLKRLY